MLRRIALSSTLVALAACSSPSGDPHATPAPDPLGKGLRIRDVADPGKPTHPPNNTTTVNVTGAALSWVDNFDETANGKSRGTVYVQDVGSTEPYSGIAIYSPGYVPADLRVAPGDVLDFTGPYNELSSIGTAKFPAGQVVIQIAKPTALFRFEYKAPDPVVIDFTDLDDFDKGRKWTSMLVTVKDVTVNGGADDGKGRVTYTLDTANNGVSVSNELFDLKTTDYAAGTKFKSITGIVTWFYSYHIAPRSKDDLVPQ